MSGRNIPGFGVLLAFMAFAASAGAQSIIKHPGDHPRYSFEAEPHLAVDPFGAEGFGPGFRGTVVLVDNGFVSSINNSIGLGFGLDWIFYSDHCDGPRCQNHSDALIPVVLQWNFWLHRQWSVFGEPGIAFHVRTHTNDKFDFDPFVIYGGGRFHFSDAAALTLRLGAPTWHDNVFSIGVSFLL
jgi:hypothetical protein